MSKVNVSLPQGTRDFGPETVRKRNYILNTIKTVFELYGFQPLETPAFENLETLMGKYGEEGDRLIFKVLNNGLNDPKNAEKAKLAFESVLKGKNSKDLTERALKYDLTIPFARYVAMNHAQLVMPFRRYQVQPVWRADKPQRGRYREFYQCDADIVGSTSLLNEVELSGIYATAFNRLKIPVEIRVNSRKILGALAELCGGSGMLTDITIAVDKLDKIGAEKVKEELGKKGLTNSQLEIVQKYLAINGSNREKLESLKKMLGGNELGSQGIAELEFLIDFPNSAAGSSLAVDFTLARGLNYYTGIIFEVKAEGIQMGSIGGGGRYDDLTGLFGVPHIPGVGISFGVDRIYDVMEELKLFPEQVNVSTQVLFFHMGEIESKKAFEVMQQLRSKGIRCEIFHENAKLDKQFRYAEKKQIPYVVIMGSKEITDDSCVLKDIRDGQQQALTINNLLHYTF
jgi:histidyl-tRNA synthetase